MKKLIAIAAALAVLSGPALAAGSTGKMTHKMMVLMKRHMQLEKEMSANDALMMDLLTKSNREFVK